MIRDASATAAQPADIEQIRTNQTGCLTSGLNILSSLNRGSRTRLPNFRHPTKDTNENLRDPSVSFANQQQRFGSAGLHCHREFREYRRLRGVLLLVADSKARLLIANSTILAWSGLVLMGRRCMFAMRQLLQPGHLRTISCRSFRKSGTQRQRDKTKAALCQ